MLKKNMLNKFKTGVIWVTALSDLWPTYGDFFSGTLPKFGSGGVTEQPQHGCQVVTNCPIQSDF